MNHAIIALAIATSIVQADWDPYGREETHQSSLFGRFMSQPAPVQSREPEPVASEGVPVEKPAPPPSPRLQQILDDAKPLGEGRISKGDSLYILPERDTGFQDLGDALGEALAPHEGDQDHGDSSVYD